MKYSFIVLIILLSCSSTAQVGGPCEGCEAALEYDPKTINNTDTVPGYEENDPKLRISGTVYQQDGKTPAGDVILYIYQTNRKGLYASTKNASGWARRHGIHRGWVQTNADGQYTFYTFRPASYPNRSEPEHIHLTVKEPNKNPYYLDSYLFDDDPLLTETERNQLEHRGGSGILKLPKQINGLITVKRDIYLGLNIPNY